MKQNEVDSLQKLEMELEKCMFFDIADEDDDEKKDDEGKKDAAKDTTKTTMDKDEDGKKDAAKATTKKDNDGKEEMAKYGLENLYFTMRNTLQELRLKAKIEGGDKEKTEAAIQDTLEWLNKNQLAEKDEFAMKQKEVDSQFIQLPTYTEVKKNVDALQVLVFRVLHFLVGGRGVGGGGQPRCWKRPRRGKSPLPQPKWW